MAEMRENIRRANLGEYLVRRTDSLFTVSINEHPFPPKFKMPSLDLYDGTHDPFDHIATFKTTMHLQGVLDEIMCRAFLTTLKGSTRVWFNKIPPNTMNSFEELSKLFVNNFIGGQRHKRSSSSLLTIEQGENESLRSFITCFNREALTMDGWMTSYFWQPSIMGLILIYSSISFMRRSLNPWLNSSMWPKTL